MVDVQNMGATRFRISEDDTQETTRDIWAEGHYLIDRLNHNIDKLSLHFGRYLNNLEFMQRAVKEKPKDGVVRLQKKTKFEKEIEAKLSEIVDEEDETVDEGETEKVPKKEPPVRMNSK